MTFKAGDLVVWRSFVNHRHKILIQEIDSLEVKWRFLEGGEKIMPGEYRQQRINSVFWATANFAPYKKYFPHENDSSNWLDILKP